MVGTYPPRRHDNNMNSYVVDNYDNNSIDDMNMDDINGVIGGNTGGSNNNDLGGNGNMKACSKCTFLNPKSAKFCEICQGYFSD